MQNKIILAALLLSLSTGAALAQSESSSTSTEVAQNSTSDAGDKAAAESETKDTAKDSQKNASTTAIVLLCPFDAHRLTIQGRQSGASGTLSDSRHPLF